MESVRYRRLQCHLMPLYACPVMLENDAFALVMSDIRLPGISGIELLEHIKKVAPRTVVIIITSHGSMQTSVKAIKLGAMDYILKPFEDLSLISDAAKRAVELFNIEVERSQMMRSLKVSNEELSRMNEVFHGMAIRDGLTDAYNHRHINEMLDEEIPVLGARACRAVARTLAGTRDKFSVALRSTARKLPTSGSVCSSNCCNTVSHSVQPATCSAIGSGSCAST